MRKILVTENIAGEEMEALKRDFDVSFDPQMWKSPEKLYAAVTDVHAIMVRNQTKVDRELIGVAKQLWVIGRAGVGLDNVDVRAASDAGVVVAFTPEQNAISVAELTLGLMLSLARLIPAADASTKIGKWERQIFTGTELFGKTLGLVGLGRIGFLVATRARAFGMKVLAHDAFISPDSVLVAESGATLVSMEDLLAQADVVSVHVPRTPQTERCINAGVFAQMKRNALFVNTSRGEVVDEPALVAALRQQRIAGAALDVRTAEPPTAGDLEKLPNVILTPHIAAFTAEGQTRVVTSICRDVAAVLRGEPAKNFVNFPQGQARMTGYQQILNTAWPSSLDSFEGVPDIFEPRVHPAHRPTWQRLPHEALVWLGGVLPGMALAALLSFLGKLLSDWIGVSVLHFEGSPISPIMLAIVLGLVIRNTVGVPVAYEQGLRFCLKAILRVGIVLLGLKLSLGGLGEIALAGVPVILICIATALIAVTFINKVLGLPKRLGTLIAVGTSICGVSAIVATAPVIGAEEDETSYAVACITIFGMLGLFIYPFVAHWLFRDPQYAGLFLGTAIHDTSQVAGAGLMYREQFGGEGALKTAMAVKLMRNVAMAGLIPIMSVWYHRSVGGSGGGGAGTRAKQPWHHLVPLFVIGFLAMVCLRSIGDMGGETGRAFGVMNHATWMRLTQAADNAAVWCLMLAMASVGLATGLSKLKSLGWKPFSVGFAAALLVGGVSAALIKTLVPILLR